MNSLFVLNKNNKGFALTELMLAVGLMFVVLGAIFVLEQMGEKFFESVSIKASLQSKAYYALGIIVRCIQESSYRESRVEGNSLLLKFPDYNDDRLYYYDIKFWKEGGKILYNDARYGIDEMEVVDGVSLLKFTSGENREDRSVYIEMEIEQKQRKIKLYSQAAFRNP